MSKNKKKSCKKGFIVRDGYTTKKGTRVEASCIKSTSLSGKKRTDEDKKQFKKIRSRQKKAEKKTRSLSKKCKKGFILRRGYIRKSFTRKNGTKVKEKYVSSKCIKDQGKPGKGKPITILKPEMLGKFGYKNVKNLPKSTRHKILGKAIKEYGPLYVWKRLNYTQIISRNRPENAKVFKEDRDWVYSNYEVKVNGKKK